MKKKLVVIICAGLLLTGCSWFKKDNNDIKKIYLNVLSNEITYVDEQKNAKFISEYTNDDYGIDSYAIIDINEDDIIDMAVKLTKIDSDDIYLLLHYYKNKVYSKTFDNVRSISISDKGYVSTLDIDTLTYTWNKYTFEDVKFKSTEVYSYNADNTKCRVDAKDYKCEDFTEKYNNWLNKTIVNPEWKPY